MGEYSLGCDSLLHFLNFTPAGHYRAETVKDRVLEESPRIIALLPHVPADNKERG